MEKEEKPKIVVGVLIYNKNKEIFLAKSKKWNDKWVVPGGHLELGETIQNCIKRETKEETNIDIEKIEFIGIQESIFSEEFHKKKHMVFLDYCAKAITYDVRLNEEFQEYIWINANEALRLKLNNSTKRFIKRFIEKIK
jgi:nucleoside triphosphatase